MKKGSGTYLVYHVILMLGSGMIKRQWLLLHHHFFCAAEETSFKCSVSVAYFSLSLFVMECMYTFRSELGKWTFSVRVNDVSITPICTSTVVRSSFVRSSFNEVLSCESYRPDGLATCESYRSIWPPNLFNEVLSCESYRPDGLATCESYRSIWPPNFYYCVIGNSYIAMFPQLCLFSDLDI